MGAARLMLRNKGVLFSLLHARAINALLFRVLYLSEGNTYCAGGF